MALLHVATKVEVRPSDLPLVVSRAEYDPKRSLVEFSVRNEGSATVVAWSVGLKTHDPIGRAAVTVDAYEHAAGLSAGPVSYRVLAPDEGASGLLPVVVRPGSAPPRLLEVQARALCCPRERPRGLAPPGDEATLRTSGRSSGSSKNG